MTDLTDLTLTGALSALKSKECSAVELTQAHINRIEKQDAKLNAFITKTPDIALAQARAADAAYANGTAGRLAGAPIAIKDLYCTKGIRTTAGSKILSNFVPQYESTVSGKLLGAGAVNLGKVSCDEFAMGSSNTTSAFGNVISPWKRTNGDTRDMVPGGSSGGSSAAVSARMCLAATGTDTGGSIRQPAAITGICGIKPTYGRCSRYGIVAYASSLDQAGAFARTVEDTALMLEVMAGHDPKDSTSANRPVPSFTESIKNTNLKGMRVGIPKEYVADGMDPAITKAWQDGAEWLRHAGAEVVEVSLPHTKYALPAYYVIAPAECSSNLARYDGMRYGLRVDGANLNDTYSKTRAAGFGNEVTRRILIGSYVLSAGYYDAYYTKAQRVRRLIYNDFVSAFEKCDALLTPATPSPAFAIGENEDDPIKMYLNDVFTVTVNLAGIPGMSVPVGVAADGLPIGLQVMGKHWDEETVFRFAKVLEDAAGFKAYPNGLL